MIKISKYLSKLEKNYTIKERIERSREAFVKILCTLPRYSHNSFLINRLDIEYESTRSKDQFLLPKIQTTMYKFSDVIEIKLALPNNENKVIGISPHEWLLKND